MNLDRNNVTTHPKSDDSIDLIDMFLQLWRGKLVIAAFTALSIIISGVYLHFAKEKWTSEAIITYPDSGQVANYTNAIGVLYSQNPSILDVQQRFFGRFNSAISALSEQLDNQAQPEKLTISAATKEQPVPLKITYTADNASQAQKTLTTYIQQINKRIVNELDNDLQSSINSKVGDLKEDLATKEKVAQEKKDKRLAILNQALIVAEQSNTKNTIVQQAETLSEDTLFALGSDALSAIIKNESTRPLPLDESYFDARQTLLAISALKSKPDSTYSFRYVMKPNLPIHRDSPKKSLVIILGFLIGLALGSVFVFARNAYKNYTAK